MWSTDKIKSSSVSLDVCSLSCWQVKCCPMTYWCICMKTHHAASVSSEIINKNQCARCLGRTSTVFDRWGGVLGYKQFLFLLHTPSVHWTSSQNLCFLFLLLFLCGFVNYNFLLLKPNKDFYLEVMVLIFSQWLTRKHAPPPWRALFSCCRVIKVIFFTMQIIFCSSTLVCLVLFFRRKSTFDFSVIYMFFSLNIIFLIHCKL